MRLTQPWFLGMQNQGPVTPGLFQLETLGIFPANLQRAILPAILKVAKGSIHQVIGYATLPAPLLSLLSPGLFQVSLTLPLLLGLPLLLAGRALPGMELPRPACNHVGANLSLKPGSARMALAFFSPRFLRLVPLPQSSSREPWLLRENLADALHLPSPFPVFVVQSSCLPLALVSRQAMKDICQASRR